MPSTTRRRFIYQAGTVVLASTCAQAIMPIIHQRRPRLAHIGIGNKGFVDLRGCAAAGAEIVALCDVDFERGAKGFRQYPQAHRYRDYRVMLDEQADHIDGVVVTTPDHTHYPAALLAVEHGKHVYVQKPLTHTIGEARRLKSAVDRAGIISQMGNQGHANEGTRLVKEWIDAGVLGEITEVHAWTDRPIWPQGQPLPVGSEPVPDTFDWNLWLGTARWREYHTAFAPWFWRGWWDFGCGGLGDMGCHLLDAPFWALDLRGDVKVSATTSGNSRVAAPEWSLITYDFPARNGRAPVKLFWYDGNKQPTLPPELERTNALPTSGCLFVGTECSLMASGAYCQSVRLMPESRMRTFSNRPAKTIPRIERGNPYLEWINACRGEGPLPGSNIPGHAADLTEFVHLGNLAIRLGGTIDWNSTMGTCRGRPDATALIHPQYRLF